VQRCYYTPVTCYQTRTYYEPVTTYRTSYYYEPVTTYRYSCYFDPCTCCYQQVACPTTCYRLRSQCCPVTSYLQRCCYVPVTSYKQCCYYEPVTTCCTPCCTPGCPTVSAPPCNGNGGTPSVTESTNGVPSIPTSPPATKPGVSESVAPSTSSNYNQYIAPQASGTNRHVPPAQPKLSNPTPPPPAVKLDRIVSLKGHNLEGQVTRGDQAPHSGARLLFVNVDRGGVQETAHADTSGEFRVTLASGNWLVYVHGPDGKPVFQTKVAVKENETRQVRLTSR
jgi:hypothetical protein